VSVADADDAGFDLARRPIYFADHKLLAAIESTNNKGGQMLKRIEVYKDGKFNDLAMAKMLVHDSPYFRVLNFNFKAGQELPIHSHDTEGQLSIVVLEGKGLFLGKDGQTLPARTGDVLISDISEPHGVRAESDMRVLVTIAPPL
jgi:quercetin dioxygenase-like cupin family protein